MSIVKDMWGSGVKIGGWDRMLSTTAPLVTGYFPRSNLALCFLTMMANKGAGFLRGKVRVRGHMKPLNAPKNVLLLFFKNSRLTWQPSLGIGFSRRR